MSRVAPRKPRYGQRCAKGDERPKIAGYNQLSLVIVAYLFRWKQVMWFNCTRNHIWSICEVKLVELKDFEVKLN